MLSVLAVLIEGPVWEVGNVLPISLGFFVSADCVPVLVIEVSTFDLLETQMPMTPSISSIVQV